MEVAVRSMEGIKKDDDLEGELDVTVIVVEGDVTILRVKKKFKVQSLSMACRGC